MKRFLNMVVRLLLIPLVFFGIFGLWEAIPFDTELSVDVYLKDASSVTLTYRANDRLTTVESSSVESLSDSRYIISFDIPRNATGIYSLNLGKENTSVKIAEAEFSYGLARRRLDYVEIAVVFSEMKRVDVATLSSSTGTYYLISENGDAVLSNIKPVEGRVVSLPTLLIVGGISIVLAVILGVLISSLWRHWGKKPTLGQWICFCIGIVLCLAFGAGAVIGGFPSFVTDHSGFESVALLEYRKLEAQRDDELSLKEQLEKQEQERQEAAKDEEPEADGPYNDAVFYPMYTGSGSDNESYNQPKISKSQLVREGLVYDNVHVGKTDERGITWYFYGDEVDEFTGADMATDRELSNLAETFTDYAEDLASLGIEFYIVVCPNKSTVYPEYVPDSVNWLPSPYTKLDQVYDYLYEHTDLKVIDLRSTLQDAKEADFPLYYEYDTHWNNYGGFAAYGQIMKAVSEDFPAVRVRQREDYSISLSESYMKDQLWYLGYYNKFDSVGPVFTPLEPSGTYLKSITPNKVSGIFNYQYTYPDGFVDWNKYSVFLNPMLEEAGAPSAYVIRDSFGISLTYFLRESFSKTVFSLTHGALPSISTVKSEDPDIVIYEVAERNLDTMLNQ